MNVFNSITTRIILLHAITIVLTSAFMPFTLYFLLQSAAEDLQHRSLQENVELIRRYLTEEPDGRVELRLPPDLKALFAESYGRYAYAIVDESGHVLFSSLRDGQALLAQGINPGPTFDSSQRGRSVFSLASIPVRAGSWQIWVQISLDMQHRDVLLDDIVREFFARVGWITIPILLFLLVIDVLIFRRALRPLIEASGFAAKIGPESISVRLPLETIPTEIKPLVRTVNEALDRLEEGFRVQRDFTADAAHELRTPLSILQARVDTLADKIAASELTRDIARMKRVVSQLLDIAELETFCVSPQETADLSAVCLEVVEFMAPVAIGQSKQISLDAPEKPAIIRGNSEVLFRALRNVVENAVRFTPPGTRVSIELTANGQLSVSDEGPGIPVSEQQYIFQRFWRQDRSRSSGSGLGLAIVKRIADAHKAKLHLTNLIPAGCRVTLEFKVQA